MLPASLHPALAWNTAILDRVNAYKELLGHRRRSHLDSSPANRNHTFSRTLSQIRFVVLLGVFEVGQVDRERRKAKEYGSTTGFRASICPFIRHLLGATQSSYPGGALNLPRGRWIPCSGAAICDTGKQDAVSKCAWNFSIVSKAPGSSFDCRPHLPRPPPSQEGKVPKQVSGALPEERL